MNKNWEECMVLLEVVGDTRMVTKFTFQGFYKEDQ